jgi:hypothetical protein
MQELSAAKFHRSLPLKTLFDHLVGNGEQRLRQRQAEHPSGDDQLRIVAPAPRAAISRPHRRTA